LFFIQTSKKKFKLLCVKRPVFSFRKNRASVEHTLNRTKITAYDQFIFILINLRKSFINYHGTHYLVNGVWLPVFKIWANANGLTSKKTQWVVGSIIDSILLHAQVQRKLNPSIHGIDVTIILQAVYFLLTVKKTLSSSMEPDSYNNLIDKFLDEYLTTTEPDYACHIHNRIKVINQLLKLNTNGIKKFKVYLQGDSSSGKYIRGAQLTVDQVAFLWFEVHIQFDLYLISNMERYIDPNYLDNLYESYKTRKDFNKIKSNFFFNIGEPDNK
jgi:hypothetical protein